MRLLLALLLMTLMGRACVAQPPYAANQPAPAPWGGYALPAQVPYQPTLECQPGGAPPADANQVWQGYPTTGVAAPAAAPAGAVYLDGAAPP